MDDMDDDDALTVAKRRCEALEHRIHALTTPEKNILLRQVQSELAFLNRLPQPSSSSSSSSSPLRLSLNIGHLESVVHILQHPSVTAVSRVCKTLNLPSASVHVDIVCCVCGSPAWFIVSDRNSKFITWDSGTGQGLRARVAQTLDAARSSPTLAPSSLFLFFSNGLSPMVRTFLRDEFGATDFGLLLPTCDGDGDGASFFEDKDDEDDFISVLPSHIKRRRRTGSYHSACVLRIEINTPAPPPSLEECQPVPDGLILVHLSQAIGESLSSLVSGLQCSPHIQLSDVQWLNYDTTALIAIVSGISNGAVDHFLSAPEAKLRSRFKSSFESVSSQVDSEILNPIHKELMFAVSGKRGIVCKTAFSEFDELLSMCGGPKEKLRAAYLLKHLRVVPDDPSSRVMSLPSTRNLTLKNKVVFGTGDRWHAPTLTANMSFVRAVTQTGMSLFVLEHGSRSLIGE